MTQTEKHLEQLQARIAELKAQYQQLQDNYDDAVLLCSSLLRALVNADYGDCETLVKHTGCSAVARPTRCNTSLRCALGMAERTANNAGYVN